MRALRSSVARAGGRQQAQMGMLVLTGLLVAAGWTAITVDVHPALRLVGIAVGIVVAVVLPFVYGVRNGLDLAPPLTVPIVLSATQNLLLLPLGPIISATDLQILLSVNLLATAILLVLAATSERRQWSHWRLWPACARVAVGVVLLVGLYSVVALALGGDPVAVIASTRNLLSVPVFLLLGLMTAARASLTRFGSIVLALAWGVLLFGALERFVPGFWQALDLAALWEKKGIPVPSYGLPSNFFSSEQFAGEQLRRMASSFADPVNLGTFLALAFIVAWHQRRHVTAVAALLGCVLAISKGALVTVLVFCLVAAWFYLSRRALLAVGAMCATVTVGFLAFSLTSSTGSVEAHLGGFSTAFRELPVAPLGHGVGNSGVLARVLSSEAEVESSAFESGVGVVVGQLGIPGIVAFGVLLAMLVLALARLRDRRSAVLGWTLLLGFCANAAFNEVALSPNSSGPYFIIIGLLVGPITAPGDRNVTIPAGATSGSVGRAALVPAGLMLLVVACTSTVATAGAPRYEATLSVEVLSGTRLTLEKTRAGRVRVTRVPSFEDWQRLGLAKQYATMARQPDIAETAARTAGLVSADDLEWRSSVARIPQLAGLTFRSEDTSADQAVRTVEAWATATAAAVLQQQDVRPGLRKSVYTRLDLASPTVVEEPPTAPFLLRHLLLGLLLGTGAGVTCWYLVVWAYQRREAETTAGTP